MRQNSVNLFLFVFAGRRFLFCLLLVTLLQSCGFHLRGAIQLPDDIHQLAIDDVTTTSQIAQVIRIELRRHDIKVLKIVDDANYVIVIDNERFSRRVMTVSPQGQVQEFELIYTVSYSILNKQIEAASITGQSLSIRRGLRFDETAVLGKTSEETRLQEDMVSNAAEQILRRLQKVSLGETRNNG